MKGVIKYGITILATVAVCVVLGLLYSNAHSASLQSDIDKLGKSLDKSLADNRELTGTVRQLHGELDNANGIVAANQSELAGNKRTITSQQLVIDAQKRAIDNIAKELANTGGDIGSKIKAIRDLARRIHNLYYPSKS